MALSLPKINYKYNKAYLMKTVQFKTFRKSIRKDPQCSARNSIYLSYYGGGGGGGGQGGNIVIGFRIDGL